MTEELAALAIRAHRAGRLGEAERFYRHWLRRDHDNVEALHGLGVALCQQGRLERARRPLARAARLRPDDARCLYHYAECLRGSGRLEASLDPYYRARRLAPDRADIALGLGRALLGLDRFVEAASVLARATASSDDAELGLDLVLALTLAGDAEAATAAWQRIVAAGSVDVDALAEHAGMTADEHRSRERWAEAATWYGRALELLPDNTALLVDRAGCLERCGRFEEALACARRATELSPTMAEAWFRLGVALETQGAFAAARAAFEQAITLRPDLARAYYHLAMMNAARGREPELRALLARPGLAEESRIDAHFALARLLEQQGRYDAAFGHYAEANRRVRRRDPFDVDAHTALIERVLELCRPQLFEARRAAADPRIVPLLIVGMPRAGTTLVERILARHPAVRAGGERDDLRGMAYRLPELVPGARPFPPGLLDLSDADVRRLARQWIDPLEEMARGRRFVTDKLPGNTVRLPFVALLAPNVRIVWCRRDPRDLCLSCYATHFDRGLRFATDLGDLARVWRLHERMRERFEETLPNPLHVLDYEALVQQPEQEIRRLLEFLGLPFEPACLRFHEGAGAIRTASFFQARQPLYRDSIGRWRGFARHLAPLLGALGPEWQW